MMNIQGIMKQAQLMQKKMEEEQAKLAQEEVEGNSGGGMVKVVLNGKFEMKKLTVDKSLVNADDIEILEDLIAAAYNDAKNKVDAKMHDSMSAMTGGLNLGGLKLPF
ncbi:MAG: YbaB/EbfC family nucleoid-associated protein [Alphaproteobacteria bacterium]|nr:YbaB/EbfC family nucleoid-associated protein [Alphaproteobacteria bacterium]